MIDQVTTEALTVALDLAMKPAAALGFGEVGALFSRLAGCAGDSYAHTVVQWLDMLRGQGEDLRLKFPDADESTIREHLRGVLLQMYEAVQTAVIASSIKKSDHVVISVHGIKTRGTWQKKLVPILSQAGFTPEPLDYGNFWAITMLVPYFGREKAEWFFQEYSNLAIQCADANFSVVAHSFGTYLVDRSLEKYSDHIRYDRIIFCGSIVRPDFPWLSYCSKGCFRLLLNEFGHLDFWAWIVAYGVKDAGQAGRSGFTATDSVIVQREHPEHRHSDYFHPLNYRKTWVPFLQRRNDLALAANIEKAPTNIKFRTTIVVVVAILLLGMAFAWWRWGK